MAKKSASAKASKSSAKKEKSPKAKGKPSIKQAKVPVKEAASSKKVSLKKPESKAKEKVLVEKVKPALMTKKGKNESESSKVANKSIPVQVVEAEVLEQPSKKKTVVSIMEEQPQPSDDQEAKAEKVAKVKPVKVDRGNTADEKAKWQELFKKYGKDKAVPYKMSDKFPSLVPIQHKVLGWGFVLTNENDRLEVLFENGIRMLISNYKS